MITFNDFIRAQCLIELPIKGRAYTWSNMQMDPLLEQIDLFFTSNNWTSTYPNTMVKPLSKPVSDHIPCVETIEISIPKSNLFRFENWWMDHHSFLPLVESVWKQSIHYADAAKRINAKMKILRKSLKNWAKTLSNLKEDILSLNALIAMLDTLAIQRFIPF